MAKPGMPQIAICFGATRHPKRWCWVPGYELARSEPSGHPVHIFRWLWFGVMIAAGFTLKIKLTDEQTLVESAEG